MENGRNELPVSEFDYNWFDRIVDAARPVGNQASRRKRVYKDLICAFDIETTRIAFSDESVMYIWQFCLLQDLDNYVAVYGRTWNEFKSFINSINALLHPCERILIYVHNLSYEFQFLRGVFEFSADDVFAVRSRKVLKCMIGNCEFRCSYLQTNMNLRAFAKKMGAPHQKTTLDYGGSRYWYTPITGDELRYCLNDVICLCESMYIQMKRDNDTQYTIPLTSTGYVRRDARTAMKKWPADFVKDQLPPYELYVELREAFRGGNTHANRYYSDILLTSDYVGLIHSADRSSSYPAVQCNNLYPISMFYPVVDPTIDKVMDLIKRRKRAILTRCRFYGIRLIDRTWGAPYLSISKCGNVYNSINDNGRILSADYLETTINDIDLSIILSEYEFDDIELYDTFHARYGKLPAPLIDCTINYYRAKTELKGTADPDLEYQYMKSKNKLNSIYGMMAQDPVKPDILFKDGDFEISHEKSGPELLDQYYRRAFLSYAWGVWVTSWARFRLEEGIRIVHDTPGAEFLYCDTDSVKYIGNVDFTEYNNARIAESKNSGSYATDPAGTTHYMGVFEVEKDMLAFKTLGAKKYCYIDIEGNTHLTVAGVGKKAGLEELRCAGGIDAFNRGMVFLRGGGLESIYNDRGPGEAVIIEDENGNMQRVTSNVTLRNSSYTLDVTQEYSNLLRGMTIEALDDSDIILDNINAWQPQPNI